MKDTLRAVFENGVFRPLEKPKGVPEHREVTLTVTVDDAPSSLADFAGRPSPDDAREMHEIVEREFERAKPESVAELVAMTGRTQPNLTRTLA